MRAAMSNAARKRTGLKRIPTKKPRKPKRPTKPVADDCVIPPAIPVKALSGLVFERDGMLHRIRLAVTAPAPIEFFFISSDRVSPATTNLNS